MDRDISGGLENLKMAETITGKTWKWNGPSYIRHPGNAVSPFYQTDSVLDPDMIISANNQKNAETEYK